MGGDKINARIRPAAAVLIEIAAAREAVGEFCDLPVIPPPKAPDVVPIFPVPFGPQDGKVAHLVTALPKIPRLSDQLYSRNHRVLLNNIEERA